MLTQHRTFATKTFLTWHFLDSDHETLMAVELAEIIRDQFDIRFIFLQPTQDNDERVLRAP